MMREGGQFVLLPKSVNITDGEQNELTLISECIIYVHVLIKYTLPEVLTMRCDRPATTGNDTRFGVYV